MTQQEQILATIVWQPVGRITVCARGRPDFGRVPRSPGFYRIRLDSGVVYIGQSGDLRRRLSEYRHPTDGNIGEEILCHAIRKAGGGQLDICAGEAFADARYRRSLETAAINAATVPGTRILNRIGRPNKLRMEAEIEVLRCRIDDLEAEIAKMAPS